MKTLLPLVGFFPIILSPNKISYFSSSISCVKKSFESLFTLKIFLYDSYFSAITPVTVTRIVDESTPAFGIVNL